MAVRDPAIKRNFKCKVCQSALELGNMGKGAVVKHSKSVKRVQNSESWKSSSAAMLASWTGAKNLQTNKFDNNLTDSSSENMINYDVSETDSKVTIDPASSSQNLDVPNQGISSSSTGSDSSIFLKWAIIESWNPYNFKLVRLDY